MTHDATPDASAATVRESFDLWRKAQIAMGHPARLVNDVIEQKAAMIRQERESTCQTCKGSGRILRCNPWGARAFFIGPYAPCPECKKTEGQK